MRRKRIHEKTAQELYQEQHDRWWKEFHIEYYGTPEEKLFLFLKRSREVVLRVLFIFGIILISWLFSLLF